MNVNRVQHILEQIEQINSEIKRRGDSVKRSNSSLRNKERNSIALPTNVSNQANDGFDHLIRQSVGRRSFCRFRPLNDETVDRLDLAASDKRVNYLPDHCQPFNRLIDDDRAFNLSNNLLNKRNSLHPSPCESEPNQPNCSKIKSENNDFLKLQKLTEKLAKTNSSTLASLDSLNPLSPLNQPSPSHQIRLENTPIGFSANKNHSTKLGISSLKTELNSKMCDQSTKVESDATTLKTEQIEETKESEEGILELSDIESALRDIDSEESQPVMKDRQDSSLTGKPNGREASYLCDKVADGTNGELTNRKILKGEIKDKNNLYRFKSLPQLNLKAKIEKKIQKNIEKNIDKLSSTNCLSNFGYDLPSTPTKNCFSLPRSFCLNARKKAIIGGQAEKAGSESPVGHKSGSSNASRANRIKAFFKTKLTSLNNSSPNSSLNNSLNLSSNNSQLETGSDSPGHLTNHSAAKRLYRQESFSDGESNGEFNNDCNANICNSSEKMSKDVDRLNVAHKMRNDNKLSERSNKSTDNAELDKGTNMSAPKCKQQFGKKISKKLNKQLHLSGSSGPASDSPKFAKNELTANDYLNHLDNSIDSCDNLSYFSGLASHELDAAVIVRLGAHIDCHLDGQLNDQLNSQFKSHLSSHLNSHLNNLNGELAADAEQKSNQTLLKSSQKPSNKTIRNKFPAFLNGGYRISRNSCQSSFSSADSGHTSVPSTSSFSSSNLARSLSFNETPTPDLAYTRMNKLKSDETNGSLSSSTTNTDSLVNYTKPSLLIDESFCQHDAELTKILLDKSKVGRSAKSLSVFPSLNFLTSMTYFAISQLNPSAFLRSVLMC